MKKTILFIFLFCGISSLSKAQLTLSGTPQYNGTYTLLNFTNPFSVDAGTNSYAMSFSGGGCHGAYYIFRKNNYWYLGEDYSCTSAIPPYTTIYVNNRLLKYKFYSTSIDPPCFGPWEQLLNSGTFINVTIAGNSCFQLPIINSTTLNPTNIQLASLTSAMIAAISNPQAGMMVYDIDNQCIKVYNGTSWNCTP